MTQTRATSRRLTWSRFGVAGGLVVLGAMSGLASRCEDMPGLGFVAVVLLVAIQGASAFGSFAACGLACMRHDFGRARVEALVGVAMLLAIPVAFVALSSLSPDCEC